MGSTGIQRDLRDAHCKGKQREKAVGKWVRKVVQSG